MNFRVFLNAVNNNNTREVKKLLSDKSFSPAKLNSFAIESSIHSNSFETFLILINDERFDPSSMDNNPLFYSIQSQNKEFFKVLIKNKKVINKLKLEWIESCFSFIKDKDKDNMKETLLNILNIKQF